MSVLTDGPQIFASNAAALGAVASGPMIAGQRAYVATFGAFFSLEPTDTQTPDNATVIAATGGGNWVRGQTAIAVAAQKQALWVIDPANSSTVASDENPGTLAQPLLTVAESARRMGSLIPSWPQATTFEWLSSAPSTDPWQFRPYAPAGVTLQSVPVVAQTTTIGVFTAKNRAGATLTTITAVGIASWAALIGTVWHDTTAGATFYIQADLGGGVAAISNPVAFPVVFTPAPKVLANGDTIERLTFPSLTVASSVCNDGFLTATQLAIAVDASLVLQTYLSTFNECTFSGGEIFDNGPSTGGSTYNSCYFFPIFGSTSMIQAGGAQLRAGVLTGNFANVQVAATLFLDGDVIVTGEINWSGQIECGAVYFANATTLNVFGPTTALFTTIGSPTYGPSGHSVIWGPGSLNVSQGAQMNLSKGGTTAAAQLIMTGALTLDGAANGSTFTPGTGLWSVGTVALTPAAVDANGAIMNPRTGSRIHIT